jgi:hypothetical protein
LYTKTVPYKDYKGKPRNGVVNFNLDEREVFKLLPELKAMFEWLDGNREADPRDLSVQEVTNFYTNFEEIMLNAWGEPSEDGQHFRKGNRFDFEESALFNASMVMFLQEPQEAIKMLEGIIPPSLSEMVQKAEAADLATATESKVEDQGAEIARLRAQLAERNVDGSDNA